MVKPHRITMYDVTLLSYNYPELTLRVHCSSGTYIRALARDIGQALGCGGTVDGDCIVLHGDLRTRLPTVLAARGVAKVTVG